MAGVILEQVSRVYPGGVAAVSEIDLEVRDQEFLVLVGPSGSGKSTTLRMIAGLEPVSAGRIWIDGQLVNDLAPQRRNVAMVFQGQALYPHLSVYGNLAFGLELRRRLGGWRRGWRRLIGRHAVASDGATGGRGADQVGAEGIAERVRRAARSLGIEPLLGRMPGELSGGERQRVALGRAIVREPAAFLFDEPLSNLDARLRVEMRRELKQLSRQLAATVIYVTHDQAEALTLGDRIAILERGKLQQLGTPEAVYERPENCFVAGFIGEPPMNLVEGSIVGRQSPAMTPSGCGPRFAIGGWSTPVAAEHWEELKQVGADGVVLGIRPEHVRLAEAGSVAADGAPAVVGVVELAGDSKTVGLDLAGGGRPRATGQGGAKEERGVQAGGMVWCKVEAERKLGLGDRVSVWFEMRRAHWFNARTGRSLCVSRGVRG